MVMPTRGFDPEDLREQLRLLNEVVNSGFEQATARFDKIDTRMNVLEGKVMGVERKVTHLDLMLGMSRRRVDDIGAQVTALDGKVEDLGAGLNRKVDDLTEAIAEIHVIVKPRKDVSGRADEARDYLRRQRDEREAAAGMG
jgi:chromosome segregation ATPase